MASVILAYIDESGDTGNPALSGSSSCYTLGCVMIKVADWPKALDELIEHRRRLRDTFGVRLQDEIKANYLIRGSGSLKRLNLSPDARSRVYRSSLASLQHVGARAFAVVTDKAESGYIGADCFDETWRMLLQRLERASAKASKGPLPIMIVHDEGEDDRVRRLVRKARRYLTAGSMFGGGLKFSLDYLVDDPVPRSSQHSYMIQMADLVAYAGWRSYMAPGAGAARVCPQAMWNNLGNARHRQANMYSGGPAPGVVIRKG